MSPRDSCCGWLMGRVVTCLASAEGVPSPALTKPRSPAVVREGAVGLSHLVGVLATLHRGTEAVGGVEDLVHEALGHRLLTTVRGVADEPAQRPRRAAGAL